MGRAIRDAVAHLESAIGDVAYNLGFHTAPHEHSGSTTGTSTSGPTS